MLDQKKIIITFFPFLAFPVCQAKSFVCRCQAEYQWRRRRRRTHGCHNGCDWKNGERRSPEKEKLKNLCLEGNRASLRVKKSWKIVERVSDGDYTRRSTCNPGQKNERRFGEREKMCRTSFDSSEKRSRTNSLGKRLKREKSGWGEKQRYRPTRWRRTGGRIKWSRPSAGSQTG